MSVRSAAPGTTVVGNGTLPPRPVNPPASRAAMRTLPVIAGSILVFFVKAAHLLAEHRGWKWQ
jgi:hypothetical protein